MSTNVINTSLISPTIFDNVINQTSLWKKYTSTVSEGQRLRGNNSLASPGFVFEDSEEVFSELAYRGLSYSCNPVIKDGYYGVNDEKHLLYSDRSVIEIFNKNSTYVPEQASIRHLCTYECDPEHVEVVTFERRPSGLYKHLYKKVATFTLLPESTRCFYWPIYHTNEFDLSSREFLVETAFRTNHEIIVNQVHQFESYFFSTNTAMSAWTSVLDSHYGTDHVVHYPYYPLSSGDVQLYTWNAAATNLASWTQTSTIAPSETGRFYTLNAKEGIAYLNTAVASYGTSYLGYKTLPAVVYYLDNEQDYYTAQEIEIGRIVDDPKHGSYYLALDNDQKYLSELSLTVEGATQYGSHWKSIYYNQPWKKVSISLIKKSSLEPITSEKIEISLTNNIGRVQNKTIYTNEEGKASFYYKPATLEEAFIPVSTSDSTTVFGSNIRYLDTNYSQIYLYSVWKDDPLIGSTSTATNEESQVWNSTSLNGRKVIFYNWSTSIYNPVTNTQGAYSPVRPVNLSGSSLYYGTSLPSYDATDTTVKVGALSVVGDLKAQLQLVYLDQTSTFTLYNQLSREQRGEAEYLGKNYSFGFRVYSSNLSAADTLDAATYLTINPFNSKYVILFEGGYYQDISNNIDFTYTIV